jgi:hypothetical protein
MATSNFDGVPEYEGETMTDLGIDQEAEALVRATADTLMGPEPGECLACFVVRMLKEFGCDNTLRWARHYRDQRAPRAVGLEARLASRGGFCDCEIFFNDVQRAEWDDPAIETLPPLPSCRGVCRGSTQPCVLWTRQRRGW